MDELLLISSKNQLKKWMWVCVFYWRREGDVRRKRKGKGMLEMKKNRMGNKKIGIGNEENERKEI